MKARLFIALFSALWLASGAAVAQSTPGNTPTLPAPVQPSDIIYIFRGNAPVYTTNVATLLAGITSGVYGPATTTTNFVPQWASGFGNLLSAGLPVGLTGNSTIVETSAAGLISDSILSTNITKAGNVFTGTGSVVLQTSPSLATPTITGSASFAGSSSGVTILQASAVAGGGLLTLPNVVGTVLTTADHGTITPANVSPVTGSGSFVLSNAPVINSPTITGALRYAILPTGQPTSYACFDGNNRLISFPFRCQ